MALTAAITMPVGFTLLQIAPRYISATDVSLFLLLEAPGALMLVGSGVLFSTLIFYTYGSRARSRPRGLPACEVVSEN
ncbi:MAG: hypothetical protein V7629_08545 [Motiliproteus sp.]